MRNDLLDDPIRANLPARRTLIAGALLGVASTAAAASGKVPLPVFTITAQQIANYVIPVAGFRTVGYAAEGDGGDAIYIKGTSAGPMATQDASGQWWVLANVGAVNAKACGATGGGTVDDTTALGQANTIATGWNVPIVLPSGRYLTTGWFGITAPIIGQNQFSTTILGSPSATSHIMTVGAVTGWSLRNLTIDAQQNGAGHALSLNGLTNAVIDNCGVLNSVLCGIYGVALTNVNVTNNYIYNCGFTSAAASLLSGGGIYLFDTSGLIQGNRIIQTGGLGIGGGSYITGTEQGDIEISYNRIYDSGRNVSQDNITAYAAGNQKIKVYHNICNLSANNGIHVGGLAVDLCGNDVLSCVGSGILWSQRLLNTQVLIPLGNGRVCGNTVTNAQGPAGIEVDVGYQGLVSDNIIVTPTNLGILLSGPTRQMPVTDNVVFFPGSHGINISGLLDSPITGNSIVLPSAGSIKTFGTLTAGSGYTPAWPSVLSPYTNVPLTGGTGTGATADVWITPGGTVDHVVMRDSGINYSVSDNLSASAANLGGTGSGFIIQVSTIWSVGAQCVNNSASSNGVPSTNVFIAGNTLAGGTYAINNSDSSASLVIGANTIRNTASVTNPYSLHSADMLVGAGGFGGSNNGLAFGRNCLATGGDSFAFGLSANTLIRVGFFAQSAGAFVSAGDAQIGRQVLMGKVTSGSTCRLSAGNLGASAHTVLNIATLTAISVTGRVLVCDTSGNAASFAVEYLMTNNAGTVAMIGTPTVTQLFSNGTSASWTVSVTADGTNLGVNITVTAVLNAQAVAELDTRETIW